MAHILIDGYNLIGIAHKSLEKARNDVIERLHLYSSAKGHDITIVFDGWKDGQRVETRMRAGNVNIIYSRLGEKADSVIKRILTEGVKPWVVVSSDREISDFAEKKDFVCLAADEFEDRVVFSLGEEPEEIFENDEIDISAAYKKRGHHKLSRKQKKKIRTLEKL